MSICCDHFLKLEVKIILVECRATKILKTEKLLSDLESFFSDSLQQKREKHFRNLRVLLSRDIRK
jgi:hypothetical protein